MKCQNNRDSAWRAVTKFLRHLSRYEHSSPSTKELHALILLNLSFNQVRADDQELDWEWIGKSAEIKALYEQPLK